MKSLLSHIDHAKQQIEKLVADLQALQHQVADHAAANGLAHDFVDNPLGLDDVHIDEDGDEIDQSVNGIADRMLIDAYNVSAGLDELRVVAMQPRGAGAS